MRNETASREFILKFQVWLKRKGLSVRDIALGTKVSKDEVDHMLSGRFPFSLSFLSKLMRRYPDFDLMASGGFVSNDRVNELEIEAKNWGKLKNALNGPEEIERVVVFYKNGTYAEYFEH